MKNYVDEFGQYYCETCNDGFFWLPTKNVTYDDDEYKIVPGSC
jgi:hypothetical protein